MNCHNCGAQLPPNANFCLNCGHPVESVSQSTTSQKTIFTELCEIIFEVPVEKNFWKGLFFASLQGANEASQNSDEDSLISIKKFIVKAIKKNGVEIIGESKSKYPNKTRIYPDSTAQKEVDNLVNKLVQDGWEPVGRGVEWFNYKFKRDS